MSAMSPAERATAREVAGLLKILRERGTPLARAMIAIDRAYPAITFREFLAALMLDKLERAPEPNDTVH